MTDFATWVMHASQESNRSLAGARMAYTAASDEPLLLAQCAAWGIIPKLEASTAHDAHTPNHITWRYGNATPCDATHDDVSHARTSQQHNAIQQHNAKQMIDEAQQHMPVVAQLTRALQRSRLLHGVRIAVSLVLEPKTAVLLRALKSAGATVGVFCEPSATQQAVAEELKREGVCVQANHAWTDQQAKQGALALLDEVRPNLIIDDGASFARLAALERPNLSAALWGIAEETTSGIRAFEAMARAHALHYPVIAVNNSPLKTDFDNAHGTGETCITTMQRLLGAHAFHGARVSVIGYGPVGKGFAVRARALGAQVRIVDINPIAALRAVFDGFEAMQLEEVLPSSDMLISATGVRHTVRLQHLQQLPEHAVVAVIGGVSHEIALDELRAAGIFADDNNDTNNISETNDIGDTSTTSDGSGTLNNTYNNTQDTAACRDLRMPNGRSIRLLSNGDGVNYTAGGGNPIAIMDLSFAVQLHAVMLLAQNHATLAPRLHTLPDATNRTIAMLALHARGFNSANSEQASADWKLTRFHDEN